MKAALAGAAIALAIALGGGEARAQYLNYPYCAVFDRSTTSCAFDTFAQCLATISGRGGYCYQNTAYQPPRKAKKLKVKPKS